MADESEKIKLALDECRMLVLGTQVLISLQFELAFQSNFSSVSAPTRALIPVALSLLLVTVILLLWGPAYHRIAGRRLGAHAVMKFFNRSECSALWPLAAAMAVDGFIAGNRLFGETVGVSAAGSIVALCATLWYAGPELARRMRPMEGQAMDKNSVGDAPSSSGEKALHEKVTLVLTEARVVLPGAQAMLGFQFVTMFTREFESLSSASKLVHVASLALIALTVVLLMTPTAFHRIAERGEDSERLVRVTSVLVIGAMVPLALGMSGDFFVIVRMISGSTAAAAVAGGAVAALAFALWFGFTSFRRAIQPPRASMPRHVPAQAA